MRGGLVASGGRRGDGADVEVAKFEIVDRDCAAGRVDPKFAAQGGSETG